MKASPLLPLFASSVVFLGMASLAAPLQFELGPPLTGKDAAVATPPSLEPGEIRRPADDVEELWQGERKILSARKILERSFSGSDPASGTWLVSAIVDPAPGEPSSAHLYLVPPHGECRDLTQKGMSATAPLISPDGAVAAFTGSCCLPGKTAENAQRLFLCDTASGEIILISYDDVSSDGENFRTSACCWSPDSRTLTFRQSWNTDGAAGILRTVTLDPPKPSPHPLKFQYGPDYSTHSAPPPGPDLFFGLGRVSDSRPGIERLPSPGVMELWQGERMIFSAHAIGDRCMSSYDPATAIWAVSAVTGERPPLKDFGNDLTYRDGKKFLDASPREIYLIFPDGTARCISLPHTDATAPLISPDGATVAFSASRVLANGMHGERKLYLYDVDSGSIAYAAADPYYGEGSRAVASYWSSDSRTLTYGDASYKRISPAIVHTLMLLPGE